MLSLFFRFNYLVACGVSSYKHVETRLHTGGSREVQALDGGIWGHIIILLVVSCTYPPFTWHVYSMYLKDDSSRKEYKYMSTTVLMHV